MTRVQRLALEALDGRAEFASAQQLHADLRSAGHAVGLSSVYRAVQRLREAGEIDETRTPAGESVYRRCAATHHHHLLCEGCGRAIELTSPATERWVAAVTREHGYELRSHHLEIVGRCPNCQSAA